MTFTINFNISGASSTFLPQLFGQFMNQRALCETAKQNEFQSARVVEIDSAPVEIDSAPVEIESAPVEIESAPVEIESAPAVEEIEPACVVVDEPEVTSTEPAEVVDLCRSPSPDFSFLQDFSDNEEAAVDDPDEDDFLPSRNIRMPSPPLCPRPKRSLSLSGRSDGKRPMLASNYRFGHSSQQSTSIAVNSLAQAKALASSSASNSARRTSESAMSSTEQGNLVQARAAIASTSTAGSAGRSFKPDNLAMARAAMSSASGSGTQSETTGMASASSASASSSRPLDVSRARAAMVAMAQWRPRTAPAAAPAASAQAAAGAAPAIEEAAAPDEAAPAPGAPNNPEPPQRSGICSVCLEKEVEAMLRCKHLFCIPCLQALKAHAFNCCTAALLYLWVVLPLFVFVMTFLHDGFSQ
ncbi:guanine nucleotide-binding protein G(s) subunit alpha isoforms XLas-like [Thrips palmi]|uniref:Guanine nucleotide-binding protein G(S) subunit alpha isoforms XLas-like n=1 Tax=Thrips palmi TaxID=161013 RepID=A0A6P9A3W6_THRPL|nr:guanine nucleotide-binding protein G(s) subunit alpha isoforms XLas-like [Thrips palmi]